MLFNVLETDLYIKKLLNLSFILGKWVIHRNEANFLVSNNFSTQLLYTGCIFFYATNFLIYL